MKRIIVKMLMWFCLIPSILLILLTPFVVFNGGSLVYIIPCLILILPFLLPYLFLRKYANKKGYFDKKKAQNRTTKENDLDKINEHVGELSEQANQILTTFTNSPEKLFTVDTEIIHDLPFDEEYLNTVLDDGKTIREHMKEGLDKALKKDDNYVDEEDDDFDDWWKVSSDEYVRSLEKKMIIKDGKELLHPDEMISKYETAIESYYELKKYCNSLGKPGKKFFSENWQHCHNSKNSDFDFVDTLKKA